mmetsp:Transcript_31350/g.102258  ORF Transcript_31350/g.102258 Transcript_31350/m.102258 type:complete len:157 (-) Transcript_31350:153-623(-)
MSCCCSKPNLEVQGCVLFKKGKGGVMVKVDAFLKNQVELMFELKLNRPGDSTEYISFTWIAAKTTKFKKNFRVMHDVKSVKGLGSVISFCERPRERKEWPTGSYRIEVRLLFNVNENDRIDEFGHKLTGAYDSRKTLTSGKPLPGELLCVFPVTVR